ncbi:MAG TPA: hypothetical protein VF576_03440, partial [Rubricoccaceae bacterium]
SGIDRDAAPTDVVLTARVWGAFGAALDLAAAVVDRWTAWPAPFAGALVGGALVGSELVVTRALPDPPDPVDSPVYGREVVVRFTVQPLP